MSRTASFSMLVTAALIATSTTASASGVASDYSNHATMAAATTTTTTCLSSEPTGDDRNGFNGIMFDIHVGSETIIFRNLIIQVSSAWSGQRPASVYLTTDGDSYTKNFDSLEKWSKVGDAMIGPAHADSFVDLGLELDHRLLPGALQGVYVDLDDSLTIRYRNGAFEGQPIEGAADGHIELRTGRGVGTTFASQFMPRQFSGAVCYDVVGPPPPPSSALLQESDCPRDGNLEIRFPPQLDEENTHLVLSGRHSATMKVTILVPIQFDSAKFSFEDATDDGASFDSNDLASNSYWTADTDSVECHTVYTGLIPWNLFRAMLGGVTEERFSETVYYGTEIEIEVTQPITLTPETLLLMLQDDEGGSPLVDTNGTDIADFDRGNMPAGSTPAPYVVASEFEHETAARRNPQIAKGGDPAAAETKVRRPLESAEADANRPTETSETAAVRPFETAKVDAKRPTETAETAAVRPFETAEADAKSTPPKTATGPQQQQRHRLLQSQHSRRVRTRIPFEVAFNLKVKLQSSADVTSSEELHVAAAVVGTSLLLVEPNSSPFVAEAQLEFVTAIPFPLFLENSTITVDDSHLNHGLRITEVVSKRDCDIEREEAVHCTQHWRVNISPEQCTLDGVFSALVYATCHADARNCVEPVPENASSTIEMDITSDDFCGITQRISAIGHLSVQSTECNALMHGRVTVASSNGGSGGGGAIKRSEIVLLRAGPSLSNSSSSFLTVHDSDSAVSILDYFASLTQPDQIDFSFEWSGDQLRCDVEANLEVFVRVEFEATSQQLLLSVTNSAQATPARVKLLADEQAMHMAASAHINAMPGQVTTGGTTGGTTGAGGGAGGSGSGDSSAATTADAGEATTGAMLVAILVVLAVALAASLVGCGVYLWRRRSKSSSSRGRQVPPPSMSPVSRWTPVPMTFASGQQSDEQINEERHSLSRVQAAMEKAKMGGGTGAPRIMLTPKMANHLQPL